MRWSSVSPTPWTRPRPSHCCTMPRTAWEQKSQPSAALSATTYPTSPTGSCWRAIPCGASSTSAEPGTRTIRGSATRSTTTEPVRASEIPIASKQQSAAVDLAVEFGFRSAAIVPAPSSGGLSRVGVLVLGSSKADFFEGDGFIGLKLVARSLAMELHEWWIGQIKRELIANARITPEDLLFLRHERMGHSTKQIATALDTSAASVDSRFQRINAKLGVPNRKAAANLAAEYGLI